MSLRTQLTLWYGLLLLAALAGCSSFLYLTMASSAMRDFDAVLRVRASEVAHELDTGEDPYLDPADVSPGELEPATLDEQSEPGAYVQVLDHHGEEVANSGTRLPTDSQQLATALNGREAIGDVPLGGSSRIRVLSMPVIIENRLVGVVQVGQTTQLLDQTLARMQRLLLGGSLGTLLLAVLSGWFLAGRALRPLARITATAQHIADTRDFSQRIPLAGTGSEVGTLGRVFNEMVSRIETAFDYQRQFLADTSHELRNPLTVIRGNLGLLRQDVDADTRVVAALEAEAEAARMSRLVDSLMLLARADAGQELERSAVQLDDLVQQVVARARLVADGRRLRVSARHPAAVLGDADRLTQVLWNLVENAIRYTPRGKAIELRLERAAGQAVLAVADEGVGIEPEHLPHIFERFYRVDKARSRHTGGSGLGLAIVEYLVRAHGGTIQVRSAPDRGTCFTIHLPLTDDAPLRRPRRRRATRAEGLTANQSANGAAV
jgi:two-component system, OmpR family, sensor kinase